ncbi:PucR family transcriptional regulator [Nocardioides sp. B-3]|uniref:PucR family transcriptional regulator n=1 Tax=Nocardioides sp. B-3 TaxID=2895565 RepID=UPI00215257B4|nr:PucR family transcriptional regulator [Nocardioides sp. B-3]UUZ61135.1 PucR family transcriptional regulator [Nocardioides sp. B-3]
MDDTLAAGVLARVEQSMDEIVVKSVDQFFARVPAYAESPDPDLRDDVLIHTRAVYAVVLAAFRDQRAARREDFAITQQQATRRVRQGIGLPDFLRAFRIGRVTLWEGIVTAAAEPESWQVAVEAATYLMNVIEVGSSIAAAAYLKAQQLELAEGDRIRRDFVEDLIAGREMRDDAKRRLATDSGLDRVGSFVVVIAEPVQPLLGDPDLRTALSSLTSAVDADQLGVVSIRQNQIVGILPVSGDGNNLLAGLERGRRSAHRLGIELVVGASTVHQGPASVPEAYREASIAHVALAGNPGLKALSTLTLVDYMVLREDTTAHRLIHPELRQFIEDDLARDGAPRSDPVGVRRQRPQCEGGRRPTPRAREHRLLPAGEDRRADRIQPAPFRRPRRAARRRTPARRRCTEHLMIRRRFGAAIRCGTGRSSKRICSRCT